MVRVDSCYDTASGKGWPSTSYLYRRWSLDSVTIPQAVRAGHQRPKRSLTPLWLCYDTASGKGWPSTIPPIKPVRRARLCYDTASGKGWPSTKMQNMTIGDIPEVTIPQAVRAGHQLTSTTEAELLKGYDTASGKGWPSTWIEYVLHQWSSHVTIPQAVRAGHQQHHGGTTRMLSRVTIPQAVRAGHQHGETIHVLPIRPSYDTASGKGWPSTVKAMAVIVQIFVTIPQAVRAGHQL